MASGMRLAQSNTMRPCILRRCVSTARRFLGPSGTDVAL